ncbi:hypothetical protein FKM82_024693 [Ascaphus truei]
MENSGYSHQPNLPVAGRPHIYGYPGYDPLREENRDCQGQQPQSTVLIMTSNDPLVRDHIVWSLFNAMFLNVCCLGFLALVFSVKSRDRKLVRDVSGAVSYGSTARYLNFAGTLLSVCFFITIFILVANGVIKLHINIG